MNGGSLALATHFLGSSPFFHVCSLPSCIAPGVYHSTSAVFLRRIERGKRSTNQALCPGSACQPLPDLQGLYCTPSVDCTSSWKLRRLLSRHVVNAEKHTRSFHLDDAFRSSHHLLLETPLRAEAAPPGACLSVDTSPSHSCCLLPPFCSPIRSPCHAILRANADHARWYAWLRRYHAIPALGSNRQSSRRPTLPLTANPLGQKQCQSLYFSEPLVPLGDSACVPTMKPQ
jgi:hypothetical protein